MIRSDEKKGRQGENDLGYKERGRVGSGKVCLQAKEKGGGKKKWWWWRCRWRERQHGPGSAAPGSRTRRPRSQREVFCRFWQATCGRKLQAPWRLWAFCL